MKLLLLCGLAVTSLAFSSFSAESLKMIVPAGYRSPAPVTVRVEALTAAGQPDLDLWDANVTLTASAGVTLSTNQVALRNGVGTALVVFTGSVNFTLTATLGGLQTNKLIQTLSGAAVTSVGGTLPGTSTTWSGVINVTNDVTIPSGHTLTILSNTLVIVNGAASGTTAPDLFVNGSIQSLGTEQLPINITCNDASLNWGQIRHTTAQPSTYRYTFISKAGRTAGEGHTGSGPAIRTLTSTIVFEDSVISDLDSAGTMIGKTMMADGSDLTFKGCVLTRSRMGPEIAGTGLMCTNSWIIDMHGPDDADGIYLHDSAGRSIILSRCVIAFGDDDAVDTLAADAIVENSILRNWPNPNEDAKGISAFEGTVRVRHCLIVDCFVGISAKSSGPLARVFIDQCTITGITRGLSATYKANATAGNIDFRVTNSIVKSVDAIYTDFGPTNFTIGYCHLSESWPGAGNLSGDPLFVNEGSGDFHLQPGSSGIDTGDPSSANDPDGSRADLGFFPFSGTLRVTLTSPASGSVFRSPTNIALAATAFATGTVTRVEFFEGANKLGEDLLAPYTLTWSNVTAGAYNLKAIVTGNGGLSATSTVVGITVVTNLLPGVSITDPLAGAAFTTPTNLTVSALASDGDGAVSKVEFYQNNVKFAEDLTSPFSVTWTNPTAAFYALTAVAIDNVNGRGTSAPVNVTVNPSGGPATNTLIAVGSVWKYLDNGSDQGTNWATSGFNDSSWTNGPAQLGYGDGDEATVISYGPDLANKYVTSYFRRTFLVANPAAVQTLILDLLRDDGAVVYINGLEVYRISMPAGPIAYNTYATEASEYPFVTTNFTPSNLVLGTNVIACEVHQGNAGSSDLSFDLGLRAVTTAQTNVAPLVTITSPASGATFGAPASLTVTALASDGDGSVTNVAFYVNNVRQTNDTVSPYLFDWLNVPPGNYSLTAVATDNTGLNSTSSVVAVTVSTNTAPPILFAKSPSPGSVTNLTQITVTFSKVVTGVDASDLLINGTGAAGVSGSGSNYTFSFPQPAYGTVSITWASSHAISDVFTPPHAFDGSGAGATWQYQLLDTVRPAMTSVDPVPASTVAALTSVSVLFSEPVTGVGATDLLINSVPAGGVSGSAAGPYLFTFPQPAPGTVQLSWAVGHGIQDLSGNPFSGGLWSYTLDTNATGIVISEIMYHPSSENILEEYIELFNKGASAVNLNGWKFTSGLNFTFPSTTIPGGGFLVVAADLATFTNKYPGVGNVVGNWTGFLNNSSDEIHLEDANGDRVNSVRYADEGDWAIRQRGLLDSGHRGWEWMAEHDGLNKSLELINPGLPNEHGQNWASSRVTNGTPGTLNSVFSNNVAPLILDVTHFPIIPRSTNNVMVTARFIDEVPGNLTVTLFYRVDSATPPPFSTVPMHDDGVNGDAVASDGLYTAVLPSFPNNAVIEYYVSATDLQGNARTWPAPAIPAPDQTGGSMQVVNALFQVDDSTYTGSQSLYKLIMTENERAELASIPAISSLQGPNSQMNGTFIGVDTAGTELRYLVGLRNRGHGSRTASPPNYRVGFRSDEPWKGVTSINLNTRGVHAQHLGSVVSRKAGIPGANTIPVQVRVNNVNRADSGTPMFGSYAANEDLASDWSKEHYPLNSGGNVYRAIRDISPPDFSYRGENRISYQNTWFKESNASEDDWTDLIGMLRVVGINNLTPFTTENVRNVVNVEEWLRHLAVMNLFGNNETGLNTGYNDDYFMYRGVNDPRFVLVYYDLDTILGEGGSLPPNSDIFSATQNNGSGQAMNRLMHWPDFEPIYYRILKELLDTTFSQNQFNSLVDQSLGSYVLPTTISAIKSWMDSRRSYVLSILPPITNNIPPFVLVSNLPRSPTPSTTASLTVSGSDVVSYRYSLNGGAYFAETPAATPINLSGLANGANTVAVIGKNSAGFWQDPTNATVRSWVVNTSWPKVRLNEILARNDSAVNHSGTYPDIIELYNEGTTVVDLSGMRLTDDLSAPSKFTFPQGTTLATGACLVVYANNPDATPGFHTGFSLNQDGDEVYLFDRVSSGEALLDSVTFGLQLADLSIGRISSGDWLLTQPSEGAANIPQGLGSSSSLKINEWLASGQSPYGEDFVELYNPNSLPAAIGGLYLTPQPVGAPGLHKIAPLSFIGASGYRVFTADGKTDPADHVNFKLPMDQGEIGLFAADLSLIDSVIYGPQTTDVSMGRCPDGALNQTALPFATPGGPNACPFTPPAPQTVNLISISNVWKYDQSGSNLLTAWRGTNYNDSAWPSGQGLLAALKAAQTLPEAVLTTLTTNTSRITFYFRTTFFVPPNSTFSSLEFRHIIDDGAVFYLNSNEVGRFQITANPVLYSSLASLTVDTASYQGPISISPSQLVPGQNVFAVEVHQSAATSSDMAFGLELNGLVITNSPVVAGLVINEVLANNATLEEVNGSKPDWVEIYNPSINAVDMADMSLSDSITTPRRWVFPTGSIVPALGFLQVRMNPDAPASATNAGFGLKANGGSVYLINRPADGGSVASSVSYGLQAPDWSIGRVPNGSTNWVLTIPTFGVGNIPASMGNPQLLKINEWMAAPASGEDWFEVFNPNPQPVDLSGLWLTDDLNSRQKYQLPDLSFIATGPYGFQRFEADNPASFQGAEHVSFKLSAGGEALGISTAAGVLINGVSFGPQATGVSEGLLPDGSGNTVSFPNSPTPGKSNFLPLSNALVNELLSHSDPPLEDALELYNPSGDDVDITGWYISDSQNNLLKYHITNTTVIPAGGFVVFYEYQFNGDNPGVPFSFSSAKGDEVYVSQASSPGVLTGYRAFAEFGAAENGVSFGRYVTSIGTDFTAMSVRTFGNDNPVSTNEFRTGTGKTNAYPKVGPVVINEIMYHPNSTNDALEYVELHNILGAPALLYDPANPGNTWRMRKGIDFNFPMGTTVPAGGFLVLVSFDPQSDPASLALFQSAYGTNMTLVGPYSGKLDNDGEAIELQKPDAPQSVPGPDFGFVPYIVVDRVVYSDAPPWPLSADGGGHSLKRVVASAYGNDPVNWAGAAPTPGAPNSSGSSNTAPLLGSIGNRSGNEGALLTFTATATDADVPTQTLTFSIDIGAPAGATINPSSGVFTWTPNEAAGPGTYALTIRVTDSGSPPMTDEETFLIIVSEVNSAPVLTAIGNKTATEGTQLTFTATAADGDLPNQSLTFSLDAGAPAGATITPAGVFTWTPSEGQGGTTNSITVRATDNGSPPQNDSETISVIVNEVNSAPVLTAIGNKTATEGTQLTFTATAADGDLPNQSLTFSLDAGAPAGATITPAGVFTWTPSESQGGTTNSITVRVTDNGSPAQNDSETITVVANEVNSAPVLAAIGNKTATEGAQLTFTATATDSDAPAQTLTFTLDAGAPAGATITPAGVFTWTPSESQGGTTNSITVRVTDNGSPAQNDSETITVVVNEVNSAPVLAAFGNKTATEGTQLTFTATATDSDAPAQTLTFTLDAGAPAGATITPAGVFTWTPSESQGGTTNSITVRVTDNGSPPQNALETITVIVNEVNSAPVLAAIGNKTATEGTQLSFTATATDSDTPAQTLTFTLDAGAPAGATITPAGVFTWTPSESQGGTTNSITVRVTDNGSPAQNDSETITVVVNEVNSAPVLAAFGNKTATEGTQLTFTATATDSDAPAQTLTFTLDAGAPAGATITPAGVFTWTPSESQGGTTNSITVRVTDNGSPPQNALETITVIVNEVNSAPVLAAIGNKTATEGTQLSFTATATDSDTPAQTLTFTLDAGAPAGATITPAGVFTWTPSEGQGGTTNSITVRVTDNGSPAQNDSETITVIVNEVNSAPVLTAIGNKMATEGTQLTFTGTATDSDAPAQTLTFTLDAGAPAGATITPAGVFTWTPSEGQGGTTNSITVRVTDNGSPPQNALETITVIVNEVNSAPVLAAIGNKTATEGTQLSFTATATDSDTPAQTLTFTLDAGAPAGATITPAGVFTWTPNESQGGTTNSITVRVTDNGSPAQNDSETITVIVDEVNSAPVLAVIGNKTATEGTQLTFTATATDSDLPTQSLTFSLDAGAPAGATITPAGVFTWTPNESQGGTTNSITVRVTDSGSPTQNDSETITIIVNEVNSTPVLAAIGNKTATEGTQLTFTATATDSDTPAQTLTFTLDAGAPAGATITPAGVFTWTPSESQGGTTNSITVRVTDNGSPAQNASETITVIVNEVNSAPVLTAIGNKTATEGTQLTFTATATDSDAPAQTLTFTLDAGAPAGATITPAGVFTWTPSESQGGTTNSITVRVTDNGSPTQNDSETITVIVSEVNAPPVLTAIGGKTATEGTQLTFTATATDSDTPAQTLTFTLDAGAPAGATITPTGVFTWTPSESQGGTTNSITVRVTDNGSPARNTSETITVIVNEGTSAPVLAAIGNKTATEGTQLTFTATATDSDTPAQTLTFTLDAGAPAGATITPAGVFTWTPSESQGGTTNSITVRVTDNGSPAQNDSEIITIIVNEVNLAPVLTGIGDKTASEGTQLTFTAAATDSDLPAQSLTFSLDAGAPAGAAITPAGVFTWTPSESQGGTTNSITVRVTDNGSPTQNDSESITIIVDEVNSAPVLTAISNKTATEGAQLTFTATATDSDAPAQTLTFTLDAGAPAGATITPAGVFTWTPNENQGGTTNSITVRVTDNGTPTQNDSESITIIVDEVNSAPVLTAIGNKTATEGTQLTFTATATDSDLPAQSLTFSLDAGAPAGAAITTAGVFTWTPSESQGGTTNSITVRVTDNGSPAQNDSETITVIVDEVNSAPVLTAIGDKMIDAGKTLTFTITASDDDLPGQSLTFTLDGGAPSGASINPTNGVLTWTPPVDHSPVTNSITIRVTDNGSPPLNNITTILITVVPAPHLLVCSVSSGVATLVWESFPGKHYQLETSVDLEVWDEAGDPIEATGTTASTTHLLQGEQNRFYRVVQVD